MILDINNCSLIDEGKFYLHDSSVKFMKYTIESRTLDVLLDTLIDEETGCSEAKITFYNIQYLEVNNENVPHNSYLDDINGWNTIDISSITNFHKNINNPFGDNDQLFGVSFEFFSQIKLNVVTSKILFKWQ